MPLLFESLAVFLPLALVLTLNALLASSSHVNASPVRSERHANAAQRLAVRQEYTSPLDFVAAVVQEAQILPELQLSNSSESVPIPVDLSTIAGNGTNLRQLQRFVSLFPAVPQTGAAPDFESYLAEIIPPPGNSSGTLNPRQRGLRVLAVGDSMSHCNEGDAH